MQQAAWIRKALTGQAAQQAPVGEAPDEHDSLFMLQGLGGPPTRTGKNLAGAVPPQAIAKRLKALSPTRRRGEETLALLDRSPFGRAMEIMAVGVCCPSHGLGVGLAEEGRGQELLKTCPESRGRRSGRFCFRSRFRLGCGLGLGSGLFNCYLGGTVCIPAS